MARRDRARSVDVAIATSPLLGGMCLRILEVLQHEVLTRLKPEERLAFACLVAPPPRPSRSSLSNAPKTAHSKPRTLFLGEIFPQLSMKVVHRRLDGWPTSPAPRPSSFFANHASSRCTDPTPRATPRRTRRRGCSTCTRTSPRTFRTRGNHPVGVGRDVPIDHEVRMATRTSRFAQSRARMSSDDASGRVRSSRVRFRGR